jgi:WD40 repeat protein
MNSKELIAQYRAGRRDFQNVDVAGIDLTWTILSDADFRGANLQGVIFNGATLHRVDFSDNANLRLADLSRADLIEANLNGANLEGANLTDTNLSRARFDEKTIFPKGFQHPRTSETTSFISIPHSTQDWEKAIAQKLTSNLAEVHKEEYTTAQNARDTFWTERDAKTIDVTWVDVEDTQSSSPSPRELITPAITWECLHTIKFHKATVNAVAISMNGKWLASSGDDRALYLWDLSTGRYAFSFLGQSQEVTSVAISPDTKIIASGCLDQKITAWHLESHNLLRTFIESGTAKSHSGPVHTVLFTPSGQKLISGGADQTIKIWNVQTGSLMRTLHGHSAAVTAVVLSPDEKTLVSGSVDQSIGLWDIETGKLRHLLTGHQAWIHALAISPDGQTLVSASNDGNLKIWNLSAGSVLHSISAHSSLMATKKIEPIISAESSKVEIDTKRQEFDKLIQECKNLSIPGFSWKRFSTQGESFNFQQHCDYWMNRKSADSVIHSIEAHTPGVISVAISPDGETIASGGSDLAIKLWSLITGQLLETLEGCCPVAFSPDGKKLVSGGANHTIKIWQKIA